MHTHFLTFLFVLEAVSNLSYSGAASKVNVTGPAGPWLVGAGLGQAPSLTSLLL